ncbi:MAG: hypothetical protein AAGB24_08065 [Bacteroidota bacterium]
MADKKKVVNALNEHFMVPIILLLTLFSLTCSLYLLNELFEKEYVVQNHYDPTMATWEYRQQCSYFAIGFLVLVLLHVYSLRLKKRWLYLLLIAVSLFVIRLFFSYL